MACIFCDEEKFVYTTEHIVSEGFGNKTYVAGKNTVCEECNNKFSGFENKALTKSIFAMERARHGIPTKKGKNAKGKIDGVVIEGDENFEKGKIFIAGFNESTLKDYSAKSNTWKLHLQTFDDSEAATSKLLLKMGYASIFTSRKKIFDQYDFSDLKNYLAGHSNNDWPLVVTDYGAASFTSIPRYTEKYLLNKIRCSLMYKEVDNSTLLFMFKYGSIPMVLNLLNRNLEWTDSFMEGDDTATLYPEHIQKKKNSQIKKEKRISPRTLLDKAEFEDESND